MTGTERRSHPGNLANLPPRTPITRTPSPTKKPHPPSSAANHLSSRSTLAQRSHQHPHVDTPNFSVNAHFAEAFGATPNYELPADGLFHADDAAAAAASSSATSANSYWLTENRSQSVPPRIAAESANSNSRSNNLRRAMPAIDTSARPLSRRESLMDEAEKRPTSPHITSATPTSARHHHLPFSSNQPSSAGHHSSSRSGSFHEHDSQRIRQNRSPAVHRVASPSLLNSGIGRVAVSAAQSIMDAMAGRSSPATTRNKHASHSDHHDSLSDDEAGKGHGRKAIPPATNRFTPSLSHTRNHAHFHDKQTSPAAFDHAQHAGQGVSADLAWHAGISESRRATPAAYRPRPATPSRRRASQHQDRQPTADDSTDMHLPDSLKSTHSSIHIGSPIVVPQARRGAVRLQPRRRRRVARPIKPKRTWRQSVLVWLATLVHFVRLLASPAEALRRFREYCTDTRISIDDAFRHPQTGMRSYYPPWLQAYVPLLIWLGISLTSTALVITFHTEVFIGLDHMAAYLQGLGLRGKLMLGSLIFLTTFPPLPLYSTLIMLCGFTFGLWQGFIISYVAALSGAIVVFVLSRSLLREWMVGLLNKSGGLKKVVRAIEKQPKLLFLVRLAPYPYNLMNTLLASSPTLTMRTYVTCTALALPKLLIHTGLGTSIKNFAAYNGAAEGVSKEEAAASQTAENVKKWAGLVGIGLCIGIMVYLLSVARRAVDELDDEADDAYDDVLLDDQGEELLSSDLDDEDGDEGDEVDDGRDRGAGVDMRERAGPSTLGFRNGYAPITASPEERLRQSMRQPQPMPGPLVLPGSSYERTSGSGSFDGRVSLSGSGSVGAPSIDLADKIAEMEAHAENMTFESPLHNGAEMHSASPRWSPLVANLEESAEQAPALLLDGQAHELDAAHGFIQQHAPHGRTWE